MLSYSFVQRIHQMLLKLNHQYYEILFKIFHGIPSGVRRQFEPNFESDAGTFPVKF